MILSSVATTHAATSTLASSYSDQFWGNFRSQEEQAKFEWSYAKCKIRDICTIKMTDFVKAKFKYLVRFKEFGWMSYLTTQYPVHENLLWVL